MLDPITGTYRLHERGDVHGASLARKVGYAAKAGGQVVHVGSENGELTGAVECPSKSTFC